MWFLISLLSMSCWSVVVVLESMVAKRYTASPVLLMWFIALFRFAPIGGIALLFNVHTSWAVPLFLVGFIYFLGGIAHYYVLKRIDVSVFNTLFAIQAIFLSAFSFAFFDERWTALQTAGSVIVIGAIVFISFWHKHISILRTVLLLSLVAVLFVPNEVISKAAVDAGLSVPAILFWSMLGHGTFSIVIPLFHPKFRRELSSFIRKIGAEFYGWEALMVVFSVLGMATTVHAYDLGQLSLVSVIFNAMPFVVMLFAWILALFLPKYAARELFTAQSLSVKLIGFFGVFIGLSLVGMG